MSNQDLHNCKEIIFNKKDFSSSVMIIKFSQRIPVELIKEKMFIFNKNAILSNFTYAHHEDVQEIVMYCYKNILSAIEEDRQVFLLCGEEQLIINKVVCRMIETSIITKEEVSIIEFEHFEETIWYPRCNYTDEITSFDREDAYIELETIVCKALPLNKRGKILEEPFFNKSYNNYTYLSEYDYTTKEYKKRINQRDSFDDALLGINND